MGTAVRKLDIVCYAALVLFAVLFLYVGNRVTAGGLGLFDPEYGFPTAEARVTRILDVSEDIIDAHMSTVSIKFEARILSGAGARGEIIEGRQNIFSLYYCLATREVSAGDRVILIWNWDDGWHLGSYVRINRVIIFGCIFIALLFIFGRVKGLSAVIALGLTCTAVFAVFIPAVLSGRNIYISAALVCVYSVVVTLFMVNGMNRKSLAAVAGCFGGIIVIAALSLIMGDVLDLTGIVDGTAEDLLFLPLDEPLNLRAIIFAGIMIGAVGAIMDVAMSIATALWEIKQRAPGLDFAGLYKSGINMGKDIVGTMANTLVLAYTGGSLSIILLLLVWSNSLAELMNLELVITELLKAITGIFGILLTMPLTALVCAALFASDKAPPYDTDNIAYLLQDDKD